MLLKDEGGSAREPRRKEISADFIVVGGGLAGCAAAIAAARRGLQVVLVHDRPVPGGNASSEIRLWVLGATCHMGSNNRWAREGGIVNEILCENFRRNPESNPLIFDAVLLEWLCREPNLTLLLNTSVDSCEKRDAETLRSVSAWNSQNQTRYHMNAPLFLDSSGDGVLGFQAGAAFRMGAESREEFGEAFAPAEAYGSLLGHSMYFYTKDVGTPVDFRAPDFALKDIEQAIPRWRDFKAGEDGCRMWWIEWGGRLDTVHDSERIKWELWKVAYGVWDWMKNSGRFPETRTMTLEWFSHIAGKRESRRFEGDHILTQNEIVAQNRFPDEVAYGGWAFDLHPSDGVYSKHPGYTHLRAHGIYGIPWRSLYSRNIKNLFLGGRLISVSHVAFGTTRVIGTLATCGEAVGVAASLCRERGLLPRECPVPDLQRLLLRQGAHLPSIPLKDPEDLVQRAEVSASSRFQLDTLPSDGRLLPVDRARGMWLPLGSGGVPRITFTVDAAAATVARCVLYTCSRPGFHTPDAMLSRLEIPLEGGPNQPLHMDFPVSLSEPGYVLASVEPNPELKIHASSALASGILAVSRGHEQKGVTDAGFHDFFIWNPARRPAPQTLALGISPALDAFGPEQVKNGRHRPTVSTNCWLASPEDPSPKMGLKWSTPQTLRRLQIHLDPDWEHPLEHVLIRHPDRVSPYLVRDFDVRGDGRILAEVRGNDQARVELRFEDPVALTTLEIEILGGHGTAPGAIFGVQGYG